VKPLWIVLPAIGVLLLNMMFSLKALAQTCTGSSDVHVFYIDTTQHVDELCGHNGTFQISLSGTSELADPGSALTNFYVSGQEHVVYFSVVGSSLHVWQTYLDNGTWINQDLSVAAKATIAPASNSPLTSAIANTPSTVPYVAYLGTDGHVIQLYYTDEWIGLDLTATTGAPVADSDSPLTGAVAATIPYVVYLSGDGHVRQLWYSPTNGNWNAYDLTELSGASIAEADSPLATHYNSYDNTSSVYYIDSSGLVHRLYYDTSWHDGGTIDSGNGIVLGTGFTSFASEPGPQGQSSYDNVFYQSDDLSLYDGSTAFSSPVEEDTALTGFAVPDTDGVTPALFYFALDVQSGSDQLTYQASEFSSLLFLTGPGGQVPSAPSPQTAGALTSRIGP
jgi:hypothetical protein